MGQTKGIPGTDIMGVLPAIGQTPLIPIRCDGVEIYAKAEYLNPGGSVKDRAALAMVLEGERSGKLTRGKTILDATSGNTGIALAMIGAVRGYQVTLCLPKNASTERKRTLGIYGAEIIETDPLEATDGAQRAATARAASMSAGRHRAVPWGGKPPSATHVSHAEGSGGGGASRWTHSG